MKIFISLLLLFFSSLLTAQEFGSKFLTVNENTLPELFLVENSFFAQKYEKLNFSKTLGVSSSNYWQPVSMEDALNKQESYLNRKQKTKSPINAETLGFRKVIKKESSIRMEVRDPYFVRRNGVQNSVYKDASVPFFYNPFHYRVVPGTEY